MDRQCDHNTNKARSASYSFLTPSSMRSAFLVLHPLQTNLIMPLSVEDKGNTSTLEAL